MAEFKGAPPILAIDGAAAWLIPNAPRGGRAHYQLASEKLSATLGRSVVVSQRPSGRPRLDAPDLELGVSLSYRDGSLLVGYSAHHAVGADIEPDDPGLDPIALAKDHFAAAEALAIANERDVTAQRDLFFRLWVAKEAVLKATGRGIYDGLDQPDFSGALATLQQDGAELRFATASRAPPGRAAVSTIKQAGAPALYLGLARLDV
ncbi:4'-phosphopantetheinyl transferase superfamily protein [Terrarubrum flagellatum]|uniref:4'-phosphopantetheinyl transferase superfamily protein n=1 Tax=Terrirubrum flagellatum TaxID=2895980 RepID=UPI003144F74C